MIDAGNVKAKWDIHEPELGLHAGVINSALLVTHQLECMDNQSLKDENF